MILSDEQVGGAVVVEVSGDDGARIFELNFVEANVGSNVFEPIRSEIAGESNFAFVVFRLTRGDEINPAVVVVVKVGQAVGTRPFRLGERDTFETCARIVTLEGERRNQK